MPMALAGQKDSHTTSGGKNGTGDRDRRLETRVGVHFRDIFSGHGPQLAADDVGGEAGAEEAAVEGSELAIINFAT